MSLDREKPGLAGYARGLGPDWTVLCDYKVYDTRPARDYGVKSVPSTIILDGRGRIRVPDSLEWMADRMVEDLRIEAFWAKKRGDSPAVPEAGKASEPSPGASAAPGDQWVFHLKSGGKLKVVSYEEKDGRYFLKLAAGASSVSKEDVERIAKLDPQEK